MDFLQTAAFAIVSALICLLLRQYRPEIAVGAAVLCGAVLLTEILHALVPVIETLHGLTAKAGISDMYLQAILKALGICYVAQLASDACRDAGQTAVAGKIELAAKAAVVVLSLPMFTEAAETAIGLLC